MNPGDFSNNQLLQLMVMFIVMALVFVGLLGFVFIGGRDGVRRRRTRKDRAVKFNLDVFEDPSNQTNLPPPPESDLTADTSVQQVPIEIINDNTGQITMTEPKKGLLKSSNLLKSNEMAQEPSSPPPPADNNQPLSANTVSGNEEEILDLSEPEFSLEDLQAEPLIPERYQTVLTVLYDRETEQIVLDVDGQRYENIGQVKARSVGQRILEVVALLLNFSNGMMAAATGVKTVPVPPAKLTSLPDPVVASPQNLTQNLGIDQAIASPPETPPPSELSSRDNSASSPATSRPPLERFDPVMPTSTPPPPATTGRRRGIFGLGGKNNAQPEIPAFNLAEEIHRVVQQQLAAEMIHTPVKIGTGRDGLLRIEVEGRVYDAVGEVEPAHIREMIQSAIQDWEQR